jgi:predicted RNA-binding protein
VGEAFLTHPYVEGAYQRVIKKYRPLKQYRVCLFLACSYGKPYSQSYIHYKIIEALRKLDKGYCNVHQVILTNLGVVPRELEDYYPFCCYDWNPAYENVKVKRMYLEVLAKRLKRYIETFRNCYEEYLCYLRHNSESYGAVKKVEKELKVRIPNIALHLRQIPEAQIKDVSLGTYTYEEDLELITPKNLKNLVREVGKLL